MINKSIKYIGVILLAYTLNACNEQRMNSSSETTTPVCPGTDHHDRNSQSGQNGGSEIRDKRQIRVDD